MARVVTPWGLDLGEIPEGPLLAYYRAEGYALDPVEDAGEVEHPGFGEQSDGVEVQLGETGTVSNDPAAPDLEKKPR